MSDDNLLKSRTAWAAVVAAVASQTEVIKNLPTAAQYGLFAVLCAYILARGFQKGMALSKKA